HVDGRPERRLEILVPGQVFPQVFAEARAATAVWGAPPRAGEAMSWDLLTGESTRQSFEHRPSFAYPGPKPRELFVLCLADNHADGMILERLKDGKMEVVARLGTVGGVHFSPDFRKYLTRVNLGETAITLLRIFDTETGTLAWERKFKGLVQQADFSP